MNEICLYYGIVCHINKLQIFPFICTSFEWVFEKTKKGPRNPKYIISLHFHFMWFENLGLGHILLIDLCMTLCSVCDNVNSPALWLMGRIEKSKKMRLDHTMSIPPRELNTILNILCMKYDFELDRKYDWFLYLWHVWRPLDIETDEFNKITGNLNELSISITSTFEWDSAFKQTTNDGNQGSLIYEIIQIQLLSKLEPESWSTTSELKTHLCIGQTQLFLQIKLLHMPFCHPINILLRSSKRYPTTPGTSINFHICFYCTAIY